MTEEGLRNVPTSGLDFNLMLTNSVWGGSEVSPELKEKLTQYFQQKGTANLLARSGWGTLSYFTRDLRLGNLEQSELDYCRHYLDLAGDLLKVDMIEPFIISLSRTASITETSQSKKGFLRKILNTIRSENVNQQLEPPKKSLFGGNKVGGS